MHATKTCRSAQGGLQNFILFVQFQIALPLTENSIILRANWPLTRWAASHPESELPP
jgi:hypothetical protein